MGKNKKRVGTYFTVEASLVLPVVIGSIIFIISFLLFWYNRCLMEQELAMIAVKASQSEAQTPEELERELREWRGECLTDKYYAWDVETIISSRKNNWLEFRRKGNLIMGETTWKADASGKALRISVAPFLRTCRKLIAGMGGKG